MGRRHKLMTAKSVLKVCSSFSNCTATLRVSKKQVKYTHHVWLQARAGESRGGRPPPGYPDRCNLPCGYVHTGGLYTQAEKMIDEKIEMEGQHFGERSNKKEWFF